MLHKKRPGALPLRVFYHVMQRNLRPRSRSPGHRRTFSARAEFRVVQHLLLFCCGRTGSLPTTANIQCKPKSKSTWHCCPKRASSFVEDTAITFYRRAPQPTSSSKFTIQKDSHTIHLVCLAAGVRRSYKYSLQHTSVAGVARRGKKQIISAARPGGIRRLLIGLDPAA